MTTVTQMAEIEELPDKTVTEKSIAKEKGHNSSHVEPNPENGETSSDAKESQKIASSSDIAEDVAEQAKYEEKKIEEKMEMTSNDEIGGDFEKRGKERKTAIRISTDDSPSHELKKRKTSKSISKSPPVVLVDNVDCKNPSNKDIKATGFEKIVQKTDDYHGSPINSNDPKFPAYLKATNSKSPTKRTRSSSSSDTPATNAFNSAEKRKRSSDNHDNENEIREKSVAMLAKALGNHEKVHSLAKIIEEAVHKEFKDANDHRYRSRIRSRVSNLNRNSAIGYQLINGKIKPERFARMTADELATRELKELREELESSIDEHLLPEREVVGTDNTKKSDNAV